MEEIKDTSKLMQSKYREWSKVLIEPAALNEARLYSLEARHDADEHLNPSVSQLDVFQVAPLINQ